MPTRREYRRALGYRIGDYGVYKTTSVGNVGGTTVICADAFRSDTSPGLLPDTHLAYAWVYMPDMAFPNQRRALKSGLAQNGTITLEAPLGQQAQTTSWVEISRLLPPSNTLTAGIGQSVEGCVIEGLRHLLIEDEFTLSITTSDEYSLSSYRFLDRQARLTAVKEAAPVAGRAPIDSSFRGWELVLDAELPKLRCRMPFATATGSITLHVRRPADTWLATSGVWAADTDGLGAEADEAVPEIAEVVTAALPFAYLAILESRSGAARAEYLARYQQALAEARNLAHWDHTRDQLPAAPAPTPTSAQVA